MKRQPALLAFLCLTATALLHAQAPPPPAEADTPQAAFEVLPTLDASVILQPQYYQGPNFTVRTPVQTFAGANQYTIDSDFGVFTADGDAVLMRRVAEINGIAALQAYSKTDEFTSAAAKAAEAPLGVARNLIKDPVATVSSVPKGIWGFLNQAGQAAKEAVDGRKSGAGEGNAIENISGFSKAKRTVALKLGVDPYSSNEVFQAELSKVTWPAYLGNLTVNLGMAAVTGGAGTALSAANLTATLTDSLRDKSPTELRLMNLGKLEGMGVPREVSDAFLNNNVFSPTTQTVLVDALAQLGNIPGQTDYIRFAATSTSERDTLAFQQSAQIMANLNKTSPVARITHLSSLPVCQTEDGTVVVPIQWDYVAWTQLADRFVTALMNQQYAAPATGYTVILTGVVSPAASAQLAARDVKVITNALPGPLQQAPSADSFPNPAVAPAE